MLREGSDLLERQKDYVREAVEKIRQKVKEPAKSV
jgi:hypothetical protein